VNWNQTTKTPQKPKSTSRNQLSHYESRSLTTKTLLWENPHLPKTIKTNDPTVYYYSIKQKKWSLLLIIFRHWRKIKKLTFWEILSFRETKSRTHEVLSNLAGCLEIKKIETLLHRYLQHRQQRIFDGWKKKLTFVLLLTKISNE
jgi:hypothetical protein